MDEWTLMDLARQYYKNAKFVLENPTEFDYWTVRKARQLVDLGVKGIYEELLKLARSYGGCVRCVYSRPCIAILDLSARVCVYNLHQDMCNRLKPYKEVESESTEKK